MKIFVGKNDEKYGPFTIDQVNESINKGEFSLEDLGWYEGLDEWRPLRNIEGIDPVPVPSAIGATVIPSSASSPPSNTATPSEEVPSHLVWGILATLCCCLPLGIVSIVYASKVEGFVAAGDIETAKEHSKKAAMWAWISFGISLLGGVIWVIIGAVSGGLEGMGDFDGSY